MYADSGGYFPVRQRYGVYYECVNFFFGSSGSTEAPVGILCCCRIKNFREPRREFLLLSRCGEFEYF